MTAQPRGRSRRRAHRTAAVLAAAVGSLLLVAGPASAHVRVFSDGAQEGHPATLRFRVPSEKADVTTVRVDVTLPRGVTPTAVPAAAGWTVRRGAAGADGTTHVVWTATAGHELRPDDHRYFDVRVGPLPEKASVTFDAAQTYSDGSVVDWDEVQKGTAVPDFPAPVLVLDAAAATASPATGAAAPSSPAAPSTPAPGVAAAPGGGTGTGSWLPWSVAGAAVLAAGAAVAVLRRPRAAARS
ncbi:DUF1775 domain-containing protein [Streptomyces sp. NPDC047002]|uniref:DUF1775 domain-containing protein n=1 Tax=Streptomyces sp. NPDC047002 TaxID=3155475 RepID=UPI00345659A0